MTDIPHLEPLNIAGATFVLQLVLIVIFALGVFLDGTPSRQNSKYQQLLTILTAMIISLLILSISDRFYPIWQPMLGEVAFEPPLSQGSALSIIFGLDYMTAYVLIRQSGGGRDSPFAPILFLLPTLSIFLRLPGMLTVIFGAATAVLFTVSIGFSNPRQSAFSASYEYPGQRSMAAFQVVTILCLIVTLLTGYITRPQAVL
ncbi:hypothetical protein M5J07_20745 [Achromobacter mucicolens]|uniref:hypothetical protein n=1 Tax=Achromobacter mucicolens TaxID=1389922 RepID=UPI0020A414BF|nr:hypothetical protein [Achromobacter mucicolens]MCP2517380.1 hypothetical protein [Achromobacter mucicolens]